MSRSDAQEIQLTPGQSARRVPLRSAINSLPENRSEETVILALATRGEASHVTMVPGRFRSSTDGEGPLRGGDYVAQEITGRIERWQGRLAHLGRAKAPDEGLLCQWTVAELIAHEALHEWWAQTLTWPLGWWSSEIGPMPLSLPDHLSAP